MLLTSGNLKVFEVSNQSNSISSWRDSSLPLSRPPLHQNHVSHLDEIDTSESEPEDRIRRAQVPPRRSVSEDSNSDSEGEMIIPSRPSATTTMRHEESNNILPDSGEANKQKVENIEEKESMTERNDPSHTSRESDIDQRISTLRKFINKTR